MIRKRDGIHVRLSDGRTVVADARSAVGDASVVSHAHSDHAPRSARAAVCSPLTAALVRARSGVSLDHVAATPEISLLPSGHVLGSRAALVTDPDGTRYLYTGDVSTRDRGYVRGFDPVAADVLIVESTYGRPEYRFPPQAALEAEIADWIEDHPRTPLFLFGYSLGKAQKLQHLVGAATNRRVLVHDSVAAVNEVIESETDLRFQSVPLSAVDRPEPDDVVVAPPGFARSEWVERYAERLGALTAGFSGWAADDSYRYRFGYDAAFVLTDHCDFDELVSLVAAVDPERVYTNHGFAEEFADHLAGALDFDAVALKRNQTTLGEF
ncbi:MAG: mRNA cleavage and polyadenylation specificity factor-like protein [Salinigranum sp.]